jgi:pyruvate ferredoxin oxidoreductase delta subunit
MPEDYNPTWQEMKLSCIITHPGADSDAKTGEWRYQRPIVDETKCNKCGLCWLFCPDCSMIPLENGFFEPDLVYCKGCGICSRECPKKAITMEQEKL